MTAEGVEDEASMRCLQAMGCTYGQGYFFGRPMPALDAGQLIAPRDRAMIAAE